MRRTAGIVCTFLLLAASPAAALTPAECTAAKTYSATHDGVSVLVLQDGQPVCEDYPTAPPATGFELYSGTKSFVGLMAAAAVQDHLLTLDEKVADTLTEWKADPLKRETTLRQLLSMTSGMPSEIGKPPTYAGAVAVAFNAKPGERFQYGPAPMQAFGEVMRRKLIAAGKSGDTLAFLKGRILDPIGLTYTEWRRGPDGQPLLPQGAIITAREWAKMGEFVRAGGKVNGKPIVDPDAFTALFKGSAANPAYGLTWWLPHPNPNPDVVTATNDVTRDYATLPTDLVMAAGAGDQRLYVIPSLHLTIVRQARLDIARAMREARPGGRGPDAWSDSAFLHALGVRR
jgi:CubicO group peptidase (beta-lactamase class C family)